MDKVKVKAKVGEIDVIINELIAEGKLDGDAGKIMLQQFIQGEIQKEITKDEGVV